VEKLFVTSNEMWWKIEKLSVKEMQFTAEKLQFRDRKIKMQKIDIDTDTEATQKMLWVFRKVVCDVIWNTFTVF